MTFKNISLGLLIAALALTQAGKTFAVDFRLIAWETPDNNLEYTTLKAAVPIRVSTDEFTNYITAKGDEPFVLFKRVEHEGKVVNQTACTITFPPELKQGVVLLLPGDQSRAISRKVLPSKLGFGTPAAPLIYNYVWLDDSLDAHPSGTIMFRNFSSLPIAIQIAGRQLTIAPKDSSIVPLAKGVRRMPFQAAAQVGGQWRMFASNPLSTDGPDRMLIILRDGPDIPSTAGSKNEPNIRIVSLFDWARTPPVAIANAATTGGQ